MYWYWQGSHPLGLLACVTVLSPPGLLSSAATREKRFQGTYTALPALSSSRQLGRTRAAAMAATADNSRAALHSLPGVCAAPDLQTKGFKFQQTMLRIKEPQRSLDFYTRASLQSAAPPATISLTTTCRHRGPLTFGFARPRFRAQ